jgi:hypothetical protein
MQIYSSKGGSQCVYVTWREMYARPYSSAQVALEAFAGSPPDSPEVDLQLLAAGPPRYYSPRHPTHFEPSLLDFNGTL